MLCAVIFLWRLDNRSPEDGHSGSPSRGEGGHGAGRVSGLRPQFQDGVEVGDIGYRHYEQTVGLLNSAMSHPDQRRESVRGLLALIEENPENLQARIAASVLAQGDGELEEVEEIQLNQILERIPDYVPSLEQLAVLYDRKGDSVTAEAMRERCGEVKNSKVDYDQALLRYVIEKNPNDLFSRHGLAQLLVGRDNYDDALKEYDLLIEHPSLPDKRRFAVEMERVRVVARVNPRGDRVNSEIDRLLAKYPDAEEQIAALRKRFNR